MPGRLETRVTHSGDGTGRAEGSGAGGAAWGWLGGRLPKFFLNPAFKLGRERPALGLGLMAGRIK